MVREPLVTNRHRYESEGMDWEAFIKLIAYKAPKERFGGPYHLDELRKQKYNGSNTIQSLLENQRD